MLDRRVENRKKNRFSYFFGVKTVSKHPVEMMNSKQSRYHCLEYILSNPQLLSQPALIVSDSLAALPTTTNSN